MALGYAGALLMLGDDSHGIPLSPFERSGVQVREYCWCLFLEGKPGSLKADWMLRPGVTKKCFLDGKTMSMAHVTVG